MISLGRGRLLFLSSLPHVSLHPAALQKESHCFTEDPRPACSFSDAVGIQEEHQDCWGMSEPCNGMVCRAPAEKPSEVQLDEGPGCQQWAGPGHTLLSGEERVFAHCDFGDNIKAGLQQP